MPLAVATTIRDQIGIRSLFMLGAKNLVGGESSLAFRVSGSDICNHITITLDPSDTYTVTSRKIRGINSVKVKEVEGVYVDQLHDILEDLTGLRVSL